MGEPLPAPKNTAINIARIVIVKLIEGVGVDLAIAAAVGAAPILANPFIGFFFKKAVEWVAQLLDTDLVNFAIKAIIRIQSGPLKKEFNESMQPIISGSATDEEIKRAREAADRLINRNR